MGGGQGGQTSFKICGRQWIGDSRSGGRAKSRAGPEIRERVTTGAVTAFVDGIVVAAVEAADRRPLLQVPKRFHEFAAVVQQMDLTQGGFLEAPGVVAVDPMAFDLAAVDGLGRRRGGRRLVRRSGLP